VFQISDFSLVGRDYFLQFFSWQFYRRHVFDISKSDISFLFGWYRWQMAVFSGARENCD